MGLVAFLPIAGPIVGLAIARGIEPGIPEKGLQANSGGDNCDPDGE
ncbi:hypothetical protein [Aestuariibacter salexigens]|nr:hypothetical protein [Aestuariibacter salexigens]